MFRQREQPEHHKETSLFEELNIDMVSSFSVSDSLHLLDLGVMKRCLIRWIGKTKTYERKWNQDLIQSTSQLLLRCNEQKPSDIHRAIRDLNTIKYWKGVEFRTILLYAGMIVLRPALRNDEYEHFLTLSCAVTICSCDKYKALIPLASKMFNVYIMQYIDLYGKHTIGSNVHNLCHITEDMAQHNTTNLSQISTYKFENSLRLLGMKLKNCNRPLEQIALRLTEISNLSNQKQDMFCDENFSPSVKYEMPCEDNNCKMFSKIFIKPDVFLSCRKKGDQWFLTRIGEIVKMKYATEINNTFKICGNSLIRKGAFFTKPLTSTKLNIYQSDGELNEHSDTYDIESIIAKMMCFGFESKFVFIPLLHSLESLSK